MHADKRPSAGINVALVGIICNALLCASKIAVGVIFAAVSVIADGFNNLGDCGSGIVALVSLIIAAKPADEGHPYGHRRAEYIASMITGFIIVSVAVELVRESIGKIVSGTQANVLPVVYVVLALSVCVKAAMCVMYGVIARRVGSDSLRAASVDSLCDCVATLAVIAGMIMCRLGINADGWIGIAVALFIFVQGIRILVDASSKLLGQAPDKQTEQRVRAIIEHTDCVLGWHDLRIYTYGSGTTFATVHVQMDANMSMIAAHTVLDKLEKEILLTENIILTTHLDPVDPNDAETAQLQQRVEQSIAHITSGIHLHDFRLVHGDTDRVIFDVSVPYSCKLSDTEVFVKVRDAVMGLGDYLPSVTVERE